MYHFILIDEASAVNENETKEKQERITENMKDKSAQSKNIIRKTAGFLYRYLDQPNADRISISKN